MFVDRKKNSNDLQNAYKSSFFFFSFKANEVFDSVYHCDSILRILKGVLQI